MVNYIHLGHQRLSENLIRAKCRLAIVSETKCLMLVTGGRDEYPYDFMAHSHAVPIKSSLYARTFHVWIKFGQVFDKEFNLPRNSHKRS